MTALKKIARKASKVIVFTTRRRRPQGASTNCTTRDEATWSAVYDVPHTEIHDLPLKEEEAQSRSSQARRASLGHK
jgi:hypothetical protein